MAASEVKCVKCRKKLLVIKREPGDCCWCPECGTFHYDDPRRGWLVGVPRRQLKPAGMPLMNEDSIRDLFPEFADY